MKIPNAERGFRAIFSAQISGSDLVGMVPVRTGETGITAMNLVMEGWLCPALLKYFLERAQRDFTPKVELEAEVALQRNGCNASLLIPCPVPVLGVFKTRERSQKQRLAGLVPPLPWRRRIRARPRSQFLRKCVREVLLAFLLLPDC